ncbi:MAG: uncharacterized protein A8A55_0558 [Amphiamblys sp. WSBS2006]|nr:MAG: uncharacterized protein A8A55_0558 [Amphiamblys sp. WSBS2006]
MLLGWLLLMVGILAKRKQYMINFYPYPKPNETAKEITEAVKRAEEWIVEHGGSVLETINESYVRVVLAHMSEEIFLLQKDEKTGPFIEKIEENKEIVSISKKDEL